VNGRFWRYVIIWVLVLGSVWVGDQFIRSALLTGDEPRPVTARGDLAPIEQATIALFEAAQPSVVYIFTEGPVVMTPQGRTRQTGAGTGFVWDGNGHIVTNFHVVERAENVRVRLFNGDTVSGRVIGAAPDHDLAVVRVTNTRIGLKPLPIGTSADLKVGQMAFAIGNPFGLSRTLTTGVVSALDRRLPTSTYREISGVIQTDAAINPGNSGGPLLDSAGRLIGVNTAIYSETGQSSGIGFAVPVDTVNSIVPALIRDGRVPRPGIGITALPEEAVPGLRGVAIGQVIPGSPAARAGLRAADPRTQSLGDVIVAVDGKPVATLGDLAEAIGRIGIGGAATVTVQRAGRSFDTRLEIVDIGG